MCHLVKQKLTTANNTQIQKKNQITQTNTPINKIHRAVKKLSHN